MKKIRITLNFILLICISLSLSTCKSTSSDNSDEKGEFMLKIKNGTSYDTSESNLIYGDITVKLIPDTDNINFTGSRKIVDYGTLAIDEASELKVAPSSFHLEINGELFEDSSFGIDDQPTSSWLLEIQVAYDNNSIGYSQEAIF
jgi:hypothetical protein